METIPKFQLVPSENDPQPPVLICFSHLRWNFVYQRPQHLMSRAAKDWKVFFLEEPVFDANAKEPSLKRTVDGSGVTVCVPTLPEGTSEAIAIEVQQHILDAILSEYRGSVTGFWYYNPLAVQFSIHLSIHREADVCVYDCMDELSAFKGASPNLAKAEHTLFGLADLVFTGGRALYESKSTSHPSVYLFPSSVDKSHFAKARNGREQEPADQAAIPDPRIGFFGVIDERFDAEMTAALAAARPDWHFVMIGPVVKIDEAELPRRENIHWLGCKQYSDLPAYLSHWDAGIMPFAMNAATKFISPTKTPEFLAPGLPVVSAPIRDVVRDWGDPGFVAIARDENEYVQKIALALEGRSKEWLEEVDAKLDRQSWDDTWRRMSLLMQHELEWRLHWRRLQTQLDTEQALADGGNV